MNDSVIDRQWFVNRLEGRQKSVRGLARHLAVDASAVSRMLSGKRKMKMNEANAIADFLSAPVEEVLKHAGVALDEGGRPTKIILAATINEDGEIERLREPRPMPPLVIERARSAVLRLGEDDQIIAAQIRASKGALAIWDDAVLLFKGSTDMDPSAVGRLSICRIKNGVQVLAYVERARKTGEATLRLPAGEMIDMILDTATPVLAVIP